MDDPYNKPVSEVIEYILEEGDSLEALARDFNTSKETIININSNLNLKQMTPGQRLQIPANRQFCPNGTPYRIKSGDTLYQIARRYETTVADILQANPGINPTSLRVGMIICIPVPPQQCSNGFVYVIQSGDTLYSLAIRYKTTVDAILKANPGLDPTQLAIGQKICIPSAKVPRPRPCPGSIYTVVAGDTIYSLARRYNTTVDAILQANPDLNPDRLMIGQKICIPVPPAPPTCPGFIYTIKSGDTLYSLSRRYNISVDAILAANPEVDPDKLMIGMKICIPVQGRS